jgi:hypothetical protein
MHIDVNYINVNAFYLYFTPILVEIDVKDIFDVTTSGFPWKSTDSWAAYLVSRKTGRI